MMTKKSAVMTPVMLYRMIMATAVVGDVPRMLLLVVELPEGDDPEVPDELNKVELFASMTISACAYLGLLLTLRSSVEARRDQRTV